MSEPNIFISYAHLDNEPLHGLDQGWIDIFHKNLEIKLGQLLGKKPEIWRDPKLHGNDYFNEEIQIKLSQAAIIVSILSPGYINSEWCIKELQEFHKQSSASGIRVERMSRIFNVHKTYVRPDERPQELKGALGYEFFGIDQATKRIREFGYDVGPNYDKRYWSKLDDLVQDIKEMIECLNCPRPLVQNRSGKTVYLAETTSDLSEEHDRIRRELQQNGHRVLPDRPLSHDGRLRKEVNSFVAESQLSVHLVGANYGIVPEGESKSIIEIQRGLASERIGASDFLQIIWMPQEINTNEKRQQEYIRELINLNLPAESVIRQSKLEDLKTLIHEKLASPVPLPESQKAIIHTQSTLKPKKAISGNGNHSPAVVYIVCDKPDYEAIKPIKDCLFQHGFELFSLVNTTDPKLHRRFLRECDAVLVYCGNTTDGWLQMKRIDLLKLRRATPMLAKAFYLTEPQTIGKQEFRIQDGIVIPSFGAFSCDSLNPFIEEIEKARGNRQ